MSSDTIFEYGIRYYDGSLVTSYGGYMSLSRSGVEETLEEESRKLSSMGIPAVYHPQMVSRKKTTTYGEWERVLDADTSA